MSVRPSRNRASGAIPLLAALHKKSWAVIDRPYSLGFATVGALYERPRYISCAKLRGGEYQRGSGGVLGGGRRIFAACSKAYASLMSTGSLQSGPNNSMPTGTPAGA